MKLIEALKRVKLNEHKIEDYTMRVKKASASLSNETPMYGDKTADKIKELLQAIQDLGNSNIRLLHAISITNNTTPVSIELNGQTITRTITEWIWRRRKYAGADATAWASLTDRGLKSISHKSSTGEVIDITVVKHYNQDKRDHMVLAYQQEPVIIDGHLEIVNATTDLVFPDNVKL